MSPTSPPTRQNTRSEHLERREQDWPDGHPFVTRLRLAHAELLSLLTPRLRADFEACETYAPPERPPLALRYAKWAVQAADEVGLEEGLERERKLFARALATEDRVEGVQALLEGRRPDFSGR